MGEGRAQAARRRHAATQARRPDATTANALIAWLEGELDRARDASNPGRPTLRRLNRAEYANAIRDLLALDVDVTSLLPPDGAAFGFDNVADAQGSSPALLQALPRRGAQDQRGRRRRRAHRRPAATPTRRARISRRTCTSTAAARNRRRTARHATRSRWTASTNSRSSLSDEPQRDARPRGSTGGRAHGRRRADPVGVHRRRQGSDRPADQPNRHVGHDRSRTGCGSALRQGGQRDVAAAFLEKTSPTFETHRLQRFIRDFANPFDAEGAPHVQSITIQGPFNAKGRRHRRARASSRARRPRQRRRRSVRAAHPLDAGEPGLPPAGLRRRNHRPDVVLRPRRRSNGSFKTGVQFGLRRILASPSFVFRPEAEPAGRAGAAPYRVTDIELASRLVVLPVEQHSRRRADARRAAGRLQSARRAGGQVRRMLADRGRPPSSSNFAGQWLHLRNLRGITPNSDLFPDFDDNLRQAFGAKPNSSSTAWCTRTAASST